MKRFCIVHLGYSIPLGAPPAKNKIMKRFCIVHLGYSIPLGAPRPFFENPSSRLNYLEKSEPEISFLKISEPETHKEKELCFWTW